MLFQVQNCKVRNSIFIYEVINNFNAGNGIITVFNPSMNVELNAGIKLICRYVKAVDLAYSWK